MATYDFRVKFMAWFNAIYFNSLPKNKIKKCCDRRQKIRVLGRKDEGSKSFEINHSMKLMVLLYEKNKEWKNHSTEFDCH